jgi:plasmid stabilization system protein ParE
VARRLIVTPRAQRQIARHRAWWLRNRDKAPAAFDEEIERGFALLLDRPQAGQAVRTRRRGKTRRILLDRIRYYMYYEVKDTIVILALWHASRRPPRL